VSDHHGGPAGVGALLLGATLLVLLVGYLAAAATAQRRGRRWSSWRTAAWCAGLAVAGVGLLGPPAAAAHHDFTAHMVGHLLVGMLAPLLLVLAGPLTVLLQALPVQGARVVSRLLQHRSVRGLTHPVTAAVLNAGGLWLLYTTDLYVAMGQHEAVHVLVHLHVLGSGYLLTAALIGVDPAPHRPGFPTRAVVLVLFLAAHAVLAKYLYAHPPAGVPAEQAQRAGMLMYYGGDLIDVVLITVLCRRWYAAARPRRSGIPAAGHDPEGPTRSSYFRLGTARLFG
jgi:putative membrane protein